MDNKQATLQLGTKPVGKLLLQYATPAIIAMTASSLYNMVDSIFIGQGVNATAISGLAITFPFMNLSAAFGAVMGTEKRDGGQTNMRSAMTLSLTKSPRRVSRRRPSATVSRPACRWGWALAMR